MRLRFKHALTMFCAALLPAQAAVAMTVQPVVIDLQTAGREMSQVVTVENTFATPLPVELNVQELELTPEGVKQTGKDPGDLLVFPPQAIIEPGQTHVQDLDDAFLVEQQVGGLDVSMYESQRPSIGARRVVSGRQRARHGPPHRSGCPTSRDRGGGIPV